MKLENSFSNGILYKNKIQNNYKNKFASKIEEIESLIKSESLEEKQKTLEIQKKNAYYKLEKIDKELQNVENYVEEDNDGIESINLNEEENLKNKIADIRQKNINVQEQIKMMRDYYNNFLLKYKNKQISDKRELNDECEKIRNDIMRNKCYTKMTEEEKIILEKENELNKLDKELEKVLKKIEEAKTKKYISNIRLKELKNNINKNNKNKEKKKETTKKRNNLSENRKSDFTNILNNIKLAQNANINNNIIRSNNRVSQEEKIESTINIINRKLPFSISALDNLINEQSNEFDAPKKVEIKKENRGFKSINQIRKKKNDFNIKIKQNINKTNLSSENNINSNEKLINNNNIFVNKNNYQKQSNKYRNFNIIKSNNIEPKNKINIQPEKNENQNKIDDNSPLGWLLDNQKTDKKRNDSLNNDNKSNGLNKNYNNNEDDIKINDEEELNKKENMFNDRNLEVSGIQGTFNRRKPFSSIKF